MMFEICVATRRYVVAAATRCSAHSSKAPSDHGAESNRSHNRAFASVSWLIITDSRQLGSREQNPMGIFSHQHWMGVQERYIQLHAGFCVAYLYCTCTVPGPYQDCRDITYHTRPIPMETGPPDPSPAGVPTSFSTRPSSPVEAAVAPLGESPQPVSPNSAPQINKISSPAPPHRPIQAKQSPKPSQSVQVTSQRSAISYHPQRLLLARSQLPNSLHHRPRLPLILLQYHPPPKYKFVSAVSFCQSFNLSERYLSWF